MDINLTLSIFHNVFTILKCFLGYIIMSIKWTYTLICLSIHFQENDLKNTNWRCDVYSLDDCYVKPFHVTLSPSLISKYAFSKEMIFCLKPLIFRWFNKIDVLLVYSQQYRMVFLLPLSFIFKFLIAISW